MANTATVSFKLPPDRRAALAALAKERGTSVSALVRDTLNWALELEHRSWFLVELPARDGIRPA
jgi:hypothetical protein